MQHHPSAPVGFEARDLAPTDAARPSRPYGKVATLTRHRRSEREALEGRKAAAELDELLGTAPVVAIDTLAAERHDGAVKATPPGRLVVALNATGDLWVVAWQNAATGEVKHGAWHRGAGDAFEDLARRCRTAGDHALRA